MTTRSSDRPPHIHGPRWRVALVAAVSILGACEIFTGDEVFEEPALIIYYGDTTDIVVPDTVTSGVPFAVSVQTFGGGCTQSIARTDVAVTNGTVELRPFNRRVGASACTDDLRFLAHTVQVRVDERGSGTIRVVGVQRGGDTGQGTAPATIERPVVVR